MVELLKIKISEVEKLQNLASKIWKEHYVMMLSCEQINYMLDKMYNTKKLEEEIGSADFFWNFIILNNTTIGYCCCKKEKLKLFLSKLYIDVSCHGKGVGQNILAKVKEIAIEEKLDSIYLTVNKENRKAVKAYEKFGFKKIENKITDIGNGFIMDDFIYEYLVD